MSVTEHTAEQATPPEHQPTSGLGMFLRLDIAVIEQQVLEMTGDDLSTSERHRFWWYRAGSAFRAIGIAAGLAVIFAVLAVIFYLGMNPDRDVSGTTLSGVLAGIIGVGFVTWMFLCGASYLADQTVGFTRRVAAFDRMASGHIRHNSHSLALFLAQASGRAARQLCRCVTDRWLNFTMRPDVADFAVSLATQFMIAVPADGPDAIRTDPGRIEAYRRFVRNTAGLVAIGRFDLIYILIDQTREQSPGLLAEPNTPGAESYLHPLRGRTTLDVVTRVVVPLIAVAISIAALVATIAK